jgi:hypothetical protein
MALPPPLSPLRALNSSSSSGRSRLESGGAGLTRSTLQREAGMTNSRASYLSSTLPTPQAMTMTSPLLMPPTTPGPLPLLTNSLSLLPQSSGLTEDQQINILINTNKVTQALVTFLLDNGVPQQYIIKGAAKGPQFLIDAEVVILKNMELRKIAAAGFSTSSLKTKSLEELIVLARSARIRKFLFDVIRATGSDPSMYTSYPNEQIMTLIAREASKNNQTMRQFSSSMRVEMPLELGESVPMSTPTAPKIIPPPQQSLALPSRTLPSSPRMMTQVQTLPVPAPLPAPLPSPPKAPMNVPMQSFMDLYSRSNDQTVRNGLSQLGVNGLENASRTKLDEQVQSLLNANGQSGLNSLYVSLGGK